MLFAVNQLQKGASHALDILGNGCRSVFFTAHVQFIRKSKFCSFRHENVGLNTT